MTRGRGSYGPLDRDRHFAVSWGAAQVVDYTRDQTIGAALRPILPAISIASRADRAVRNLRMGMQVGGRDEAQKPPSVVGQELLHTVADRQRAIATLSTYWKALANDLVLWQEANKGSSKANVAAQWLAADVMPTLEEWNGFAENQNKSWWTKAATSWETYERWWDRSRQMRALARAHGIELQSSEPTPLPKTIWQKGAEGNGNQAIALLGVLKVGVFTALMITGAVSLLSVIRDLRPTKVVE